MESMLKLLPGACTGCVYFYTPLPYICTRVIFAAAVDFPFWPVSNGLWEIIMMGKIARKHMTDIIR